MAHCGGVIQGLHDWCKSESESRRLAQFLGRTDYEQGGGCRQLLMPLAKPISNSFYEKVQVAPEEKLQEIEVNVTNFNRNAYYLLLPRHMHSGLLNLKI